MGSRMTTVAYISTALCIQAGLQCIISAYIITGFVTRLTRRVPLGEQELITLSEHLSSPPLFSGIRVTRSLVLCVCCVHRCLSFCTFPFDHCVVRSSLIYGFWLSIWYLQTLLSIFKLLSIVFSVLLLTDSDYPFGIFKQLVITLGVPRVTILITFCSLKRTNHSSYIYYLGS
jgi:hypothetical protein